jgi:NAD(P)-dependent dehydrogenase (short-subunit alcohol dehydrogenase family)
VFNNAGLGGKGGCLWEGSLENWNWAFGANVCGVANGSKSFAPVILLETTKGQAYQGIIMITASM